MERNGRATTDVILLRHNRFGKGVRSVNLYGLKMFAVWLKITRSFHSNLNRVVNAFRDIYGSEWLCWGMGFQFFNCYQNMLMLLRANVLRSITQKKLKDGDRINGKCLNQDEKKYLFSQFCRPVSQFFQLFPEGEIANFSLLENAPVHGLSSTSCFKSLSYIYFLLVNPIANIVLILPVRVQRLLRFENTL